MLFSSPVFIFFFLPATLGIALLLRVYGRGTLPFLVFVSAASLAFYAYANPVWLPLIVFSVLTNFYLGALIGKATSYKRLKLSLGIVFNLGLLAYFKYADFLIVNANNLFGLDQATLNVLLPIGISFYTFQQIAYLVDVYDTPELQHRFLDYLFFVSFFPQLIAGPIVHHRELIPQLAKVKARVVSEDLAWGLCLFFIGLAKKVLIADTFGQYAGSYFDNPSPNTLQAWMGVSAYSLQIYFDFSGYSDMALGLARMFGLKLPVNFDSPYQARSIVDFWRRWHITLSRFLKDYLYIPLGGNRKGKPRRYANLTVTMLLGGLWHGAGWGFVIWGALHGLYLCINHGLSALSMPRWLRRCGWPITLIAVVFAWVPFRAIDLEQTLLIWQAMVGMAVHSSAFSPDASILVHLAIGWLVVCFLPNSQQLMSYLFANSEIEARKHPLLHGEFPSYVRPAFAATAACAAAIGLALNNRIAEFLYFQF